jgi:hypothetical protein
MSSNKPINSQTKESKMIKYFIYPGEVKSYSDGDIHYISGNKLIELYGVNPSECKIIRTPEDERGYDTSNVMFLYPRMSGNYKIVMPKEQL